MLEVRTQNSDYCTFARHKIAEAKASAGPEVAEQTLQNVEAGQIMHRPDPRRSFGAIGCGGQDRHPPTRHETQARLPRHLVPYIECSACAATPIAASQRHRPGRPIFLDLGAIPGLKTAPRPENSGPRPASLPGLGVLSRWRKLQRHRTRLRISRILPRANIP